MCSADDVGAMAAVVWAALLVVPAQVPRVSSLALVDSGPCAKARRLGFCSDVFEHLGRIAAAKGGRNCLIALLRSGAQRAAAS
ncbi:hypothetical protein SLS62_011448, partial [Diatrype stigma]